MNDLVSIIMPAYNTGKYISRSIRSVIAQTYPEWELIIIDDCSADNTAEVVRSFDDRRIRLLSNKKNSGAAVSRNYGLREATGKYVAFLDSDDVWHPEKLSRQLSFMKENDYVFTCTDYRIKRSSGWEPYCWTGPFKVDRKKIYQWCWFSTITVIYDREKIGLVQIDDIKKNNDYAMWFQITKKAPCYRLPECLSYYIKRDNSVTSGGSLKMIKWHYRLFRIALKKSPVVSVALTLYNLFFGVLKKLIYKKPIPEGQEDPLF